MLPPSWPNTIAYFVSGVRYCLREGRYTDYSDNRKSLPGNKIMVWWLCVRATPTTVTFALPNGERITYQVVVEGEGFRPQQVTGPVEDDTGVTFDYLGLSVIARDSFPRFLYPESIKEECDRICRTTNICSTHVRWVNTMTPQVKPEWNLTQAEIRELRLFALSIDAKY